jgi:hypothetical protein
MRVTNDIPLGCSLLLPVGTVNCVQTLKAHGSANGYRCYEPNCYQLTSHLPAFDELCLVRTGILCHARAEVCHARVEVCHARVEVCHARVEVCYARVEVCHARVEVCHARAEVCHAREDV